MMVEQRSKEEQALRDILWQLCIEAVRWGESPKKNGDPTPTHLIDKFSVQIYAWTHAEFNDPETEQIDGKPF